MIGSSEWASQISAFLNPSWNVLGDVMVCLGAFPSWDVLGASCSCFGLMMCQWLCGLIPFWCHRLESAVFNVEILQFDVRQRQKIVGVCLSRGHSACLLCNSSVATGPKGLDERAWTNGVFWQNIFFRGRVFYAFTLLVAVSCARVTTVLTA